MFINHEDQKASQRREKNLEAMRTALKGVDLFAQLSREELDRLADSAKLAPFVRGEIVTRQGAKAHWLYVLTRGEVEVMVAKADGIERHVAVLKAPSFFGEMALVTGAPREATVIAREDTECLRVDKDDFREVLAGRPELAQEISEILAQRRVELTSAKENLDADTRSRRDSERTEEDPRGDPGFLRDGQLTPRSLGTSRSRSAPATQTTRKSGEPGAAWLQSATDAGRVSLGTRNRTRPAQPRLARGPSFIEPGQSREVRCAADQVRRLLGFAEDFLDGFHESVERLLGLGLGRLDHERAADDQGKVHRRRVDAVVDQALGEIEGADAGLGFEVAIGEDDFVQRRCRRRR